LQPNRKDVVVNSYLVVRYTTRPDAADENQRLMEDVFTQLVTDAPDQLRYATFRLGDGASFLHIEQWEGEGPSPIPQLAKFRNFQDTLDDRLADPPVAADASPVAADATLVGAYRLLQVPDGIEEVDAAAQTS
jgi:hypothetical protein